MLSIHHLVVSRCDVPDAIISDLSCDMHAGQVHAIMGPNGSGKSTLAAALMGYPTYEIQDGTILLNGEDITALSIEARAQKGIFLAHQQPLVIPGVSVATLLKEVLRNRDGDNFSVTAFHERLYRMMELLGLPAHFADRALHEGCSGGERKRLEMLQLLMLNPRIAILDEIDSGLDVDSLKLIARAISFARSEYPTMIVVLITHYNRILEHITPDYVHILKAGRFVQSGDHTLAHEIERDGYALWEDHAG